MFVLDLLDVFTVINKLIEKKFIKIIDELFGVSVGRQLTGGKNEPSE